VDAASQMPLAPLYCPLVDVDAQVIKFTDCTQKADRQAALAAANVQYPAFPCALEVLFQPDGLLLGGSQVKSIILELRAAPSAVRRRDNAAIH